MRGDTGPDWQDRLNWGWNAADVVPSTSKSSIAGGDVEEGVRWMIPRT
jgi:hypothetical protein